MMVFFTPPAEELQPLFFRHFRFSAAACFQSPRLLSGQLRSVIALASPLIAFSYCHLSAFAIELR